MTEIDRADAAALLDDPDHQAGDFRLEEFFPYLTRVYYTHVTRAVSRIYIERYDMRPGEWRTMAILGPDQSLTAMQIVERSSMDKVSVSRAVAGLRKRGWIVERVNRLDGRSRVIRLARAGKRVYFDLVPRMLEVEQVLLADLSDAELTTLKSAYRKIQNASKRLAGTTEA